MTTELTSNPLDGTYGYICTEHGVHRYGLTSKHAVNVERKHLREQHHPDLEQIVTNLVVDLTGAARMAMTAYTAGAFDQVDGALIAMWEQLTGRTGDDARALAEYLSEREGQVVAAAVPL